MDGVLSDFQSKMTEITGEPHDESRYETDPQYKKRMWKAVETYTKDGGEVWYELDLMPDAMQLWKYVKKYDPVILSATGKPIYKAEGQKKRWMREKIDPNATVHTVQAAADKHKFAGPNHVLIDDKEKALGPWRNAGGIGILHTSAANTINQLKKLGL